MKTYSILRYVVALGLLLLGFVDQAFALSSSLQLPPLDMSMSILGSIFGTVNASVGPGMGPTLMGQIYGQFNSIIMSIAMVYMTYSTIIITFDATAKMQRISEGTLVNICMRTAIGLALLVPNTNGYNMAQVLMMWLVNQSVALADSLWATVINYYESNQPFYINPAAVWNTNGSFYSGGNLGSTFGGTFLKNAATYAACVDMKNWQLENTPAGQAAIGANTSPYQIVYVAAQSTSQMGCVNFGAVTESAMSTCASAPTTPTSPTCGSITFGTNPYDLQYNGGTVNLSNQLTYEDTMYSIVMAMSAYATSLMSVDAYFSPSGSGAPAPSTTCKIIPATSTAPITLQNNCPSMGDPFTPPKTAFGYAAQNFSSYAANSFNLFFDYFMMNQQNASGVGPATNQYEDTMNGTGNGLKGFTLGECFAMNVLSHQGEFVSCSSQLGWMYAGLGYIPLVGSGYQSVNLGSNANYITAIEKNIYNGSDATLVNGTICASVSDTTPGCGGNGIVGTGGQSNDDAADDFVYWIGDWAQNALSYYANRVGSNTIKTSCSSLSGMKGMAGKMLKAGGGWQVCKPMQVMTSLKVFLGGVIGTELPEKLDALALNVVNPSIGFASLGFELLKEANSLFAAMITSMILLVIAAVVSWVPFIGVNLTPIFALVYGIFLSMMMLFYNWGFMLAFYVPMVPVLIFVSAGLGWVFIVVEAMTAAPLAAAALIHPEGDGFLGKAEPAIMLSLNIFLRPSLLIIGWTAAILMVPVCYGYMHDMLFGVLTYLGYSFMGTAPTHTMNSSNLVIKIAMITVFMGILVPLIPQIYMITTYLPDKILRWMGDQSGGFAEAFATQSMLGATESHGKDAGREGGQLMEKTFSDVGKTASKYAKGGGGAGDDDDGGGGEGGKGAGSNTGGGGGGGGGGG